MEKVVKFTPELTELIKSGKKTTTWRSFDDKNLSVGDRITLATRDGEVVTNFGEAIITDITLRTVDTIQPEDYSGQNPSRDPIADHKASYGDRLKPDSEVKIIKFKVTNLYS